MFNESESLLTRQAAEGDPVALRVLLTESRQRLCDHVGRKLPNDLQATVDVDDIVQEAHIGVFRSIQSFEPNGDGSFYRWLATIALNRLRSVIKAKRALRRGGQFRQLPGAGGQWDDSTIALLDMLAGPGRTPSRSAARIEAIDAVQSALATIPDHYRQAICLVHLEGRPVKEVAADMGCSERAVHGLCRRGLKQLEAHLRSASRFFSTTS